MATIYKRGKSYAYMVDIPNPVDGKRKRINKSGFRTKKEAQEAAHKLEISLNAGEYYIDGNIPFSDLAAMWLDEHSPFIRESTAIRYQTKVRQVSKYFSKKRVNQITRMDLQKYMNHLASERSLANVSEFKVTLKQIFDFACRNSMLNQNPCTHVKIPPCRVKPKEKAYMEKETLFKFLDAVKESYNDIFYTIFITLAYTGMRCGELTALKWSDIGFAEKTISITKNLFQTKNKTYKITPPKTKRSIRKIIVSEELIKKLEEHSHNQKIYRVLNADTYVDQQFVFTNKYGNPIFNYEIYNKCKIVSEKLGLANIHPHSFRHTHTSLLAEAGVPLEVIQDRLGHSDDSVTKEIYLHITKKLQDEAAKKFDNLMDGYKMVTK